MGLGPFESQHDVRWSLGISPFRRQDTDIMVPMAGAAGGTPGTQVETVVTATEWVVSTPNFYFAAWRTGLSKTYDMDDEDLFET
jgi:hypothetical protein